MHKRLAQQIRGSQPCFGNTHWISQQDLRFEKLIKEREDNAVEEFVDLILVIRVEREMGAENNALKMGDSGVSDFARGIGGLASKGG